jgi:hypothetical protein
MPTRFALAVALMLACLAALPVRAASNVEFPYIAYVTGGDALVRSGPGRKHYATAQAPAGYAVEVYRHDGNGWCAIRPPEGSFCLVPLRDVQPIDDRTAQVAGEGVAARVGSALGDHRSAVQVMLNRGEAVALLESPSPTNPWVRIAPPAGEFRWIAARRLSLDPPTEGGARPTPAGVAALPTRPITTSEPDDSLPATGDPFGHLVRTVAAPPTPPNPREAAPSDSAWASQALAVDPRAAGVTPTAAMADDVDIIPGSPAADQQSRYMQTAAAPIDPAVIGAPATPGGPPRVRFEGLTERRWTGPLDPRVMEMQVHLSQIVLGTPASWQFSTLRDEANGLLAEEQASECREQLRDLLDRIAAFENIQARYRGLPPDLKTIATNGGQGAAAVTNSAVGANSYATDIRARALSDLGFASGSDAARENGVTPTPGAAEGPALEALYDAVGRLKPVVSRRQNAPQFALIDDQGEVVTFVTASPDVNLQAYVGQRIGVRGSRGFMPEFRRAHVVASRVTNLENTVVK